jgi:hypothetical protein
VGAKTRAIAFTLLATATNWGNPNHHHTADNGNEHLFESIIHNNNCEQFA